MENSLSDVAFATLPLHPDLQRGLADAGYAFCTPIQAQTLPESLAGHDVMGQAQTGTGKTAAFLLAVMDRLLRQPALAGRGDADPRALIVAPTRELAIQIHKDALVLGGHCGLRFGLAYGGVDYDKQRKALVDGVDVLIGTPGRLIDYHKQHVFTLKYAQAAVLDEADRMFDLGFIKDVRYLFRRMPPPEQRLSMLFSATLSLRVSELAYEHMNNPVTVEIAPDRRTADKVTQVLYHVASEEKLPLLLGLLKRDDPARTLVFVNTKAAAARVESTLRANDINASALSGDVPQKKRQRLMTDFAEGNIAVLVATDVAARGLHIPDVSHVVNYDLPQNAEDYVHRIGRTARAGASGDAISLACEEYVFSLPEIEHYIGHAVPTSGYDESMLADIKIPEGEGRRRGNRPHRARRSGRPRQRA
ncbi:MAG: DEAD/DEAH box helicase [Gammaproteobacteria bacterium]|nr:DEAD/DEAH box helicase [Gammaproteobacteria bacterium]